MKLWYHLLVIVFLFSQAKEKQWEPTGLKNAVMSGNFENVKTEWSKLSKARKDQVIKDRDLIISVYFQAAEHNDISMFQWLIDNVKLDLNIKSFEGDTKYTIEAAVNYNKLEAVNFLLEKGANIKNISPAKYDSFIKYAKDHKQYLIDHKLNEILKLLN